MRFFRKILSSGCYGLFSIPKPIFNIWADSGYTHVEMVYDDVHNTLIVCPL